jgi:hypothetical protein
MTRLTDRNIELADEPMIRLSRTLTREQRRAMASGMFELAKQRLRDHLHSRHPDWDEQTLHRELVRRIHDAG